MRFKLIPARRRHITFVEFQGNAQGALWEGEDLSTELGCQVLVCEAPLGGLVREIGLVGTDPDAEAKRKGKR